AVTLGLECAYHAIAQDSTVWAGLVRGLRLSALLALVIVATNVLREEYSLENVMAQKPGIQRVASLWLIAWAAVLVVSFMTKTTN
ncbi:exopolysaccharide biosynthesis polyprenyl glycosylphosphotransferase, partial [Escherichia coli]|nr:exopolysaccharide biosynthesis polyprenyl glycosylphosphotransferase [Escherichia coli]